MIVSDSTGLDRVLAMTWAVEENQHWAYLPSLQGWFETYGATWYEHRDEEAAVLGVVSDALIREGKRATMAQRARELELSPLVTAARAHVLRQRLFHGKPGTGFPPPDVTEQRSLAKHDFREQFGFNEEYGDGAAITAGHFPTLDKNWFLTWEFWGERVARVSRLWVVADEAGAHAVPALPAGTPGPVYAALREDCQAALTPDRESVANYTSEGNVAKRDLLALEYLAVLGFDGPFATSYFDSYLAFFTQIDGAQLRRVWQDGEAWLEEGRDGAYAAAMPKAQVLAAANRFLKEWWGIEVGLLFGPQQRVRPGLHRSGAAKTADRWGIVRWWRHAVPEPRRLARRY